MVIDVLVSFSVSIFVIIRYEIFLTTLVNNNPRKLKEKQLLVIKFLARNFFDVYLMYGIQNGTLG